MRYVFATALASALVVLGCSDRGTILRNDIGNVPRLEVSPSKLQFTASPGDSADATLTLSNTGRDTLHVAGVISSADNLVILSWPATIPPNATGTVEVRYRATGSPLQAEIIITSDAWPGVLEIPVTGGSGAAAVTYTADVKPIFQTSCALSGCHDATTQQAGLNLLVYAQAKARVTPGSPASSLLFIYVNTGYMPFERAKLPEAQISLISQWIEDGALE